MSSGGGWVPGLCQETWPLPAAALLRIGTRLPKARPSSLWRPQGPWGCWVWAEEHACLGTPELGAGRWGGPLVLSSTSRKTTLFSVTEQPTGSLSSQA